MSNRWRLWLARWIEWRAAQIHDPLARLRYLRNITRANQVPAVPARPVRRHWTYWLRPAAGLMFLGMLIALLSPTDSAFVEAHGADRKLPLPGRVQAREKSEEVWMVEQKEGVETYSNGLRIETSRTVGNEPRADRDYSIDGYGVILSSVQPRGIVFHTTESHMAPFSADQNRRLQLAGLWLLNYVRDNHSYHYLVDRFGRVHRIVREDHAAWHAGQSIWSDAERVYAGLNHSFLGVSFESETRRGDRVPDSVTPAQVHAAKTLTQMLRSRYRIDAVNCVTHAQVSVNPDRMLIGLHTDWASNFPFAELGLPDNYERPLAAMFVFGYGYDDDFVAATGSRLWKGLAAAENQVRLEATARGLPVSRYRALLQHRYRKTATAAGPAPARANQEIQSKE